MGIRDHPTAPRSPWQNGHAEGLIGSIRRECLDHIVVLGDAHLPRIRADYTGNSNELRTHRSLSKDSPSHRSIQRFGQNIPRPILGRLHHEYCRMQLSVRTGGGAAPACGGGLLPEGPGAGWQTRGGSSRGAPETEAPAADARRSPGKKKPAPVRTGRVPRTSGSRRMTSGSKTVRHVCNAAGGQRLPRTCALPVAAVARQSSPKAQDS